MQEPVFQIKQEEKGENYAKLVITPLEQGYGNTLGIALRRVLLSSLSGTAITSVKISGVKHQFSTLKGLKEDILDFALNLKKVRIKYTGDKPINLSLSVKGKKDVTAGEIEVPGDAEIVNKDLVIATLSGDAKLEAKMEAEKGVGYVPAEEQEREKVGLIPLDATFSPVTRVNYKVEETRVGRKTNYDKLILEVWTDGTIEPQGAVVDAAKIVISYFELIVNPKEIKEEPKEESENDLGPMAHLSVEEVGLPTRVANALIKSGYETVEGLVNADRKELVKVRNLGEKSIEIIEKALQEKGISLNAQK